MLHLTSTAIDQPISIPLCTRYLASALLCYLYLLSVQASFSHVVCVFPGDCVNNVV